MRFLVVTNLYPPQELGGYGRSIADFVGGLISRGHQLQVLCSDAPYLAPSHPSCAYGPSGELVYRSLRLKGSYENGVSLLSDSSACVSVDASNQRELQNFLTLPWDGILIGNLDLLGPELLHHLVRPGCPVLHHIGFMTPPFDPRQMPDVSHYHLLTASSSVRDALVSHGFVVRTDSVVYPGARCDLFGSEVTGRVSNVLIAKALADAGYAVGTAANPLRIGFAGLMMASKGAHTVVHALIELHQQGVVLQAGFAGGDFQAGYREHLQRLLDDAALGHLVHFYGQLGRRQLARFWSLHQVGVFASIYPEAFGIVGAEIMASGLVLVTTGVGGATELIEPEISGVCFQPSNPLSLVSALKQLMADPELLLAISQAGQRRVRRLFSVESAAAQLERMFNESTHHRLQN
jgi:glycogen(starch) synthase